MATYSHNLEWMTAEALKFIEAALDASTPFFAYFNPTPPHQGSTTDGDWVRNALQDTSASTGFGPYYCDSSPAGSISDAWAASCKTSLSAAADFSAWCTGCAMKTRQQLWDSTAGLGGDPVRSKLSGIAWADESLGVLYTYLSEQSALASTVVVVTSDNGDAKGSVYECNRRSRPNLGPCPPCPAGRSLCSARLLTQSDRRPIRCLSCLLIRRCADDASCALWRDHRRHPRRHVRRRQGVQP